MRIWSSRHLRTLSRVVISTVFLWGCDGGESAGAPEAEAVRQGSLFPVVVGMRYETETEQGTISSDGHYSYRDGETVSFSVGLFTVGFAQAGAAVSPVELNDDVASVNLLRLLLALDVDGSFSNGVELVPLAPVATALDLQDEQSLVGGLRQLSPSATLAAPDAPVILAELSRLRTVALEGMSDFGQLYEPAPAGQYKIASAIEGEIGRIRSIRLDGQPNWTTGEVAGVLAYELSDGTLTSGPLPEGSFPDPATPGARIEYRVKPVYGRPSLLAATFIGGPHIGFAQVMRDFSFPNLPPVVGLKFGYEISPKWSTLTISASGDGTSEYVSDYEFKCTPIGSTVNIGSPFSGAADYDGSIAQIRWSSTLGKEAEGDSLFLENVSSKTEFSVTLEATDNDGATTSVTQVFQSGSAALRHPYIQCALEACPRMEPLFKVDLAEVVICKNGCESPYYQFYESAPPGSDYICSVSLDEAQQSALDACMDACPDRPAAPLDLTALCSQEEYLVLRGCNPNPYCR
jgi:hypothetical protein